MSAQSRSQFTNKEILLAKGHEQLQLAPLLTFCLIQCDALRPKQGSFNPSIDSQCAAAANMYNMSPSVLSRCIAPRLELWSSDSDTIQPLHDSLNMTFKEMKKENSDKPLLLFLDSPRQILIYNYNERSDSEVGESEVTIPNALVKAIQRTARSYRISPPCESNISRQCRKIDTEVAYNHIRDALVEDSSLSRCTSYDEWLNIIADELHNLVMTDFFIIEN